MPTTSALGLHHSTAAIDLGRFAAMAQQSAPIEATTFSPAMMELHQQQQQQQQQVVIESVNSAPLQFLHMAPSDGTALINALVASFSVILVSELGDKTFIITAIMAMKNSRLLVFIASALALFMMTVLSVGMGVAVTIIPKLYTHYASIVLFLCFGFKMLKEAYDMKDEGDEFEEVERSLEKGDSQQIKAPAGQDDRRMLGGHGDSEPDKSMRHAEEEMSQAPSTVPVNKHEDGWLKKMTKTLYAAPIIIKVFTMVFVAEWGDRSQISTIILAAREDVVGVFVGSFVGHVLCTGLAVIGGRFVAEMISVKTMTLIGGMIFLFFAVFAIISGPE